MQFLITLWAYDNLNFFQFSDTGVNVRPASLVFSLALLSAFSTGLHAESLRKASIEGISIQVEMADTPLERQKGLMFRAELPENQGMLFRFDKAETQCMWMKNTLIDLDVAFVDRNLRVINIEEMKAGTTQIHCSEKPATWALEMNGSWFAKNKIGAGGKLELGK